MKYANILRLSNLFLKSAQEYSIQDIVKNMMSLRSFAARLKYCKNNFKKLGAGTARVVFLLSDGKVLKLAKKRKRRSSK